MHRKQYYWFGTANPLLADGMKILFLHHKCWYILDVNEIGYKLLLRLEELPVRGPLSTVQLCQNILEINMPFGSELLLLTLVP